MARLDMKKPRPFTGYHAAAILIAFFAVVVGVNFLMARFAVSTFGGTVVDNSYVASQKFNGWLAEARREREMGWKVGQPAHLDGHLVVSVTDALGQPLSGAKVTMRAEHPLGRLPGHDVRFTETAPGAYRSIDPVAPGRWKLRTHIVQAKRELDLALEIS